MNMKNKKLTIDTRAYLQEAFNRLNEDTDNSSRQFSVGDKVVVVTDEDNLRKTGFEKYRDYTALNGKRGTIVYKEIDLDNAPYMGEWDGKSYMYRVHFSGMPKDFKLPGALLKQYKDNYRDSAPETNSMMDKCATTVFNRLESITTKYEDTLSPEEIKECIEDAVERFLAYAFK